MQELADLRGQLLAAESTAADAVKEAGQLRQQLRSAQSRSQNPTAAPDVAELSRQTSSIFDRVMKETFEALKDEFQPSVVYKVLAVASCLTCTAESLALSAYDATLLFCTGPSNCMLYFRRKLGKLCASRQREFRGSRVAEQTIQFWLAVELKLLWCREWRLSTSSGLSCASKQWQLNRRLRILLHSNCQE